MKNIIAPYDRNKPGIKVKLANSKNLGGQNDNENKMMITTDDKQDYKNYLS
jgi:hypothetical protein